MIEASFRAMTPYERRVLSRLLSQDFPGRDELAIQLIHCRVRTIDEDGSLEIETESRIKAAAAKSRVPTEGEAEDRDGVTIHFLLHVVDGAICELEIYKEDNSRVATWPPVQEIRVFAPA